MKKLGEVSKGHERAKPLKFSYKTLFTLIGISLSGSSLAQTGVALTVQVCEKGDKITLPGANLVLKRGSKTVREVATDTSGKFMFPDLDTGRYLLTASYLSHDTRTISVSVNNNTKLVVELAETDRQLNEVKIKDKAPAITLKGDTMVYNTAAYKTKPYATIEDLLKMLPGVEVDNDGNVTVNGQKVDQIRIDGRLFFVSDFRNGTQTLPADIAAQLMVYDSQSEETRQSGIPEYTNTKTLDIILKSDKKNGFVGQSYAGIGNGDAYAVGGNVDLLSPKALFSLIAGNNNINDQFTGSEKNIAGGTSGKQQLTNLSLDYKNDGNKKLKITLSGSYKNNQSSQQNSSQRQTFLADSSLLQNQSGNAKNSFRNFKVDAWLVYKPSDHDFISYKFSFTPSKTSQNVTDSSLILTHKTDTAYTNSLGRNLNSSMQSNYNWGNDVNFIHKFSKPGRTLVISFNQYINTQEQQTNIFNYLKTSYPAAIELTDQLQLDPSNSKHYSAKIGYEEPLIKTLSLIVNYSWQNSESNSNQHSYDFNPKNGLFDLQDTLTTNNFVNRQNSQQLGVRISGGGTSSGSNLISITNKGTLNYSAGINLKSTDQDDENLTNGLDTRQNYLSWSPTAVLSFLKQGEILGLDYNGQSQLPTIQQLQPLPNLNNPYLVNVGNPNLSQAFIHRFEGQYILSNSKSQTEISLNLNADITQNAISQSIDILPGGVQRLGYVNLNGIYHFNCGASFEFPLPGQQNGNGNIGANLLFGQNRNVINGNLNTQHNEGESGFVKFNYHAGNWLFIESNASLAYTGNRYASSDEMSSKTLQQNYSLDVNATLPFSVMTGIKFNRQFNSASGLPNQQNNLLSAFISKGIFQGGAGQLRLSGINLLNAKTAINESIGSDYIQITKTNIPQRLLLLSLVYHFNKFYKTSRA